MKAVVDSMSGGMWSITKSNDPTFCAKVFGGKSVNQGVESAG